MKQNDFKSAVEPWESSDDLQAFQKKLVLHVLVMDNYTLINRRSSRLEFQSALTAANIETIVAAISDELKAHFLPDAAEHRAIEHQHILQETHNLF